MIKAVFFDLYQTLVYFAPPREELHASALKEFGIDVKPEVFNRPMAVADKFISEKTGSAIVKGQSEEDKRALWAQYEEVVLREATAKKEPMAFSLKARMAISPPQRAVERLAVELFQFGAATSQPGLFDRKEEGGREAGGMELDEGAVPPALREAVKELKLKLGYSPLYRVVEVDPWSRIPERRYALLNFEP